MKVSRHEHALTALVGAKLDAESISDLDEIASKLGVNRSVIIRKAIWEFLDRYEEEKNHEPRS